MSASRVRPSDDGAPDDGRILTETVIRWLEGRVFVSVSKASLQTQVSASTSFSINRPIGSMRRPASTSRRNYLNHTRTRSPAARLYAHSHSGVLAKELGQKLAHLLWLFL